MIPEKELQTVLMDAGNRLLKPPADVDDLLPILDELERFLQNVEQSPSETMLNALCTSMKALVAKELLRHSDMDVKVAVASCISEITRITAPDAPYDDELMKEIFQMIVASFENLFDLDSRSYNKRVSILETVAKIRSCVVMLDLECDTLILEMFHHFLKSIRDYHSGNIFSSMATIMTMVLEESEDISSELLSSLLASVKKENKEFSATACRLGEEVIGKCAMKLKPYLLQEVQSMGLSLDNYSKIVTSICQETFDIMENEDFQAEDSKISERPSDEPPQVAEKLVPELTRDIDAAVDKSPKSVMSNGTTQTMSENMLVDTTFPNKKPEDSRQSNQSKSTMAGMESDPDNLDDSKTVKPEKMADHFTKRTRVRKSKSIVHSTEISEKKTQVSSPTGSHNETTSVVPPSQQLPDATPPKRVRRGPKKKGGANAESDLPNSPSDEKGNLAGDQVEPERPPSAGIVSEKESEGNSDLETKSLRSSSKKVPAKDETPPTNINSKKETDGVSELETKPQRRSGKRVHTGNAREGETSGKLRDKTKRKKGGPTSEKGATEEVSKEVTYDMVSPSKSPIKASSKDQSHMEESHNTKSKKKRVPKKEETPEVLNLPKDLGENLVGCKVKVWWPDDQMFYEGVIDSFDPVEKKHKVVYEDEDVETLLLSEEKWEIVKGDNSIPDEQGQAPDLSSPGNSFEMPRKKKAKTASDSATKEAKVDTPLKRGGSTSARKSKGNPTQESGRKAKVDATPSGSRSKSSTPKHGIKSRGTNPKTDSKAKDGTRKTDSKSNTGTPKTDSKSNTGIPKTGSKSDNGTPKTGNKSKDNLPKRATIPIRGTPKTGSKSKDDSPKTNSRRPGGKSITNGTSSKGKSGSTKAQESEVSAKAKSGSAKAQETEASAKGKSGSAKAQDSEVENGKKRRRSVRG